MVRVEDDAEIPESGAVFTFGKSKFSDNVPSKFWIRNNAIVQVACGDEHSIVVTANGRCYVFGSNNFGQLGLGHTKNITKPTCIKALKQEKIVCAAGGRSHSLLATESGRVYAFGSNNEGQLGLGDMSDRIEPTIISSIEDQVKMVTAGSYHSAVVTASGKLFIFGSNSEGQLGLDDTKNVAAPTELQLAVNITWAACGYYHTAVVGDGKLFLFGEKEGGKLGLLDKQLQKKSNRPQCIFSITEKISAVSCGGNHTAALTDCGKLYTFGSGINGQLALGTMIMETGAPSLVGALDGQTVISVSCGESHTAIVTERGRLYTCGDGRHGKLALGNENFSNQFNPVYVKRFAGFFVHKVACGGCHMLVLASKQLDNDWDNQSGGEGASDGQDNADLGFTARNRRRQKDLKPLLNIESSFKRGQDSTILDSLDKKDAEREKLNDLEQLEKHLMEMDENYHEKKGGATSAEDDVDSVLSEVSQFNKTHELSQVGKNDSKLVPVKTSVPPDFEVEKSEENVVRPHVENAVVAAIQVNSVKKTQQQEESEEESEESEDEDDEEEEEEEEETPAAAENATASNEHQNKKKVESQPTENVPENAKAENTKPEKKESFLKKMFSFKKRRAKSKSEETITGEKQNDSKDAVDGTAESKTVKETLQSNDSAVNEAKKEEETKVAVANDKTEVSEKKATESEKKATESEKKVTESEKKAVIDEAPSKKSGSAKSAKESGKIAVNQSSKTCNII